MSGFLINLGRKRTLYITGAIVIISCCFIFYLLYLRVNYYPYQSTILIWTLYREFFLISLFTVLIILSYNGKKSARHLLILTLIVKLFFTFKTLAFFSSMVLSTRLSLVFPILNAIIYSTALYHFAFSKSFTLFFENKNLLKG
jgi:hypothetical protein